MPEYKDYRKQKVDVMQKVEAADAESIPMKVIAYIHTDFPTKFGIPRQSGIVGELKSTIVFEPEYRNPDALRGIEGFTHIWLIWAFS
ncbi:MAG: putative methyltransferase, YaeB/AF family, partial [Firmicutes bacterium]|nr:putative methyltransferase, YaeB/AF family [Bacillota bacterium]